MNFRKSYTLACKQAIRWFPGHMGKGMKQIEQTLKTTDCIIEVHDARIPFSGRNFKFRESVGDIKPRILVLNKKDLTEVREQRQLIKKLREKEGIQHVLFTNCKSQQCKGILQLMPLAHELITNSERYNRMGERDCSVMIIGVPNVGKSSLLNILRNRYLKKKGAAQVGAIAGVTRSVMEKIKICDNPLMYMVDTPGILAPRIDDDEMGMKLALVGCLKDHLVGEDKIADYLLYWLNRQQIFDYVHLTGLEKPTDDITELLVSCANMFGVKRKIKRVDGQVFLVPDLLYAASYFIKQFRQGNLGRLNLDKPFKT